MTKNNFYNVLTSSFSKNKNKLAFLVPESKNLTYFQFDELVNIICSNLLKMNVKPGERILAQIKKSPEGIALYLACLKIGAIFVPLNTSYSIEELKFFVNDSKPVLFITDPEKKEKINTLINKNLTTSALDKNKNGLLVKNLNKSAKQYIYSAKENEIASIIYTSGTTGTPKGAKLSHKNLHSNAISLTRIWKFKSNDVLLHALPTYHVHGLFVAIHCALIKTSTILFLPKFEIESIIKCLKKSSVMMGVPTYYSRMISSNKLSKSICSNIRLFISGSAPLNTKTWKEFFHLTGHEILERYGMSETGMITSNPYNGSRVPDTVGFPLPDVQVRIVDKCNKVLTNGQTGEIQVKGPNVFSGYWNLDQINKLSFTSDDFFNTGDLGKIDKEGRVSIVGRSKELIISGGLNVYPKEVENIIDGIDSIKESAVIGLPDNDFGEIVIAIIVKDKNSKISEIEIFNTLNKNLAKFKHPKKIFFIEELPRNVMGKVQKNILRERHK